MLLGKLFGLQLQHFHSDGFVPAHLQRTLLAVSGGPGKPPRPQVASGAVCCLLGVPVAKAALNESVYASERCVWGLDQRAAVQDCRREAWRSWQLPLTARLGPRPLDSLFTDHYKSVLICRQARV